MPVSRRISEQAKSLQTDLNEAGDKKERPRLSVKREKGEGVAEPSSASSAYADAPPSSASSASPSVLQRLTFDGLEVRADTSLEGVTSARTLRRRVASKANQAARKKRKRSPALPAASSAASADDADGLAALHRRSAPPSRGDMHLIRNQRERRAIERRVERDEDLVTAAVAHRLIEPERSAPGLSVDRTAVAETWRLSQELLAASVDARTAERRFDLALSKGPYSVELSRNGRFALIGGRRGHVALMEWKSRRLLCEMDVLDEVRDVAFLHNHQMYAVAQKAAVYLYDATGLELHVLPQHADALALDFLPYHFLLAAVGSAGWLKFHDTSTGTLVAQHRTKLGPCSVLTHSPRTAVSFLGHQNGVVTLWSPTMKEPLVRMLTHKAAVSAVAVSADGVHMVSGGLEGQWKVWDCRMYRELHAYFSVRPVSALQLSQTGLVGLSYGSHVAVWKDALASKASAPYLTHSLPGQQSASLAFCPYEDALLLGHSGGVSSLLVPGSGLLAYDSLTADPFESAAQTRERTVHSLLEKLQPDMIGLDDAVVGMMDAQSRSTWEGERRDLRLRREEEERAKSASKEKMRGGQKSSKRWRRKRSNIIDAAAAERREERERSDVAKAKERKERTESGQHVPSALDRFSRKSR